MEITHSFHVEDEVEETEKMLELKKKEWELDHLQSIKEAEEKKHAEEDDMFFTYARDDTYSKVINKFSPDKRRRRTRKKATEDDSPATCDENSPRNVSPTPGNIHFRIQPLIMKLGDERIAQIKKVAQEAIEAKTIQNVSEFVKTRVRKQATFFKSTSPNYTQSSPKGKKGSQNDVNSSPKGKQVSQNVIQGSPKVKQGSQKVAKHHKVNQGSGKVSQGSTTVSQDDPKCNQGSTKVTQGSQNVNQKPVKRGRPCGKKNSTPVSQKSCTDDNPIHCKSQAITMNGKIGDVNSFDSTQPSHPMPKNRGAVRLKDFISQSQSNLCLKSETRNAMNIESPPSMSHELLPKINNTSPNTYTNISVISNGINPYLQNNIIHQSFPNWNGVMPNNDLNINPYMDGTDISLPKFSHNSMPDTSRGFPNYDLSNMRSISKGNDSKLLDNDHVHSFNYLSSNSDIAYVNTMKNETDTHILPARPIVLSQIPSAASSPLHSPASSDSGSDVRRSSRTPRPKFIDNNDWFLFS